MILIFDLPTLVPSLVDFLQTFSFKTIPGNDKGITHPLDEAF
jgi:hypothetical protein